MPGRPKHRARVYTSLELAAWELAARLRVELPSQYRAAAAGPSDWCPETDCESEWCSATHGIREFERSISSIAGRAREKAGLNRLPLSWLSAGELRDLLAELHLKLSPIISNDPGDPIATANLFRDANREIQENRECKSLITA